MDTEQKATGHNGTKVSNSNATLCNLILRFLAAVATLVAAIVMGVAKETQTVSVTVSPTLPPLSLLMTVKSNFSSAFVYFIAANAIACFHSTLSLVLSIVKKTKLTTPISIADMVVVALLFSGLGAGAAIGVVGERGMPNVGWNKVCNVYTKFCGQAVASIVVSFVACLAYVILVSLALVGSPKK